MQTDVKGEGPSLILVGGGLTGWLSWIPHQQRLGTTRRVTRVQPLCVQFGLENRAIPNGYSIDYESDALAATLRGLESGGPIDLVGWSYGAAIALDYALDHPDDIRTLTLIEPPAIWVLAATGRLDAQSRRESDALRALHAGMTAEVTEEQLEAFVRQAGFCPPGTEPRQLSSWTSWTQHRRSLRTGDAVWNHHDSVTRLRAFDRPVLLVKGTGSSHFLHQIIEGLASELPRSRTLELPGGHAPQIVAMEEFLSTLDDFLSR